jgi:hypothetical protein
MYQRIQAGKKSKERERREITKKRSRKEGKEIDKERYEGKKQGK